MFTIRVQASCFSTVLTAIAEGKHSKISGGNRYFQHTALLWTLGWSIFCYSHVLKETRQSGELNLWTKHIDNECYTINFRKWRIFCHYQRKSGLHIFLFSSSNKPPNLQSFMQVKEGSTTENRNMSCANFKKATLHPYSHKFCSLSLSFSFFKSFPRATLKSKYLFRLCGVLKSNPD